ncbi:OmpA family protein [Sandaracinomonas limnophila]|uniref:OmpA family protein n=1 Tax=Sandaracinomonas limnophila TaxID=1862386 RepID=A0A437PPM9_9BACT|nr:OmpA family protein [Sandaracinomonas limnophila]RVU24232.1 OmpA family protein [Sandaracinomonas limnophila]
MKKLLLFLCLTTPLLAQQKPENLGAAVNSEYLELHPVMAPDGKTLYFTRKNHPSNKFGAIGSETIAGSQDIWYSENNGGVWTPARRMSDILNRDQYNTILSISPDGQTILVKGAYVNGQYQSRGFSIAKKTANGWSIPEKLNIPSYEKMNKGKNETAFLSMDGKILLMAFSEKRNSDKDDLYISFLNDGEWSKPQNMGSKINTEFSETTPFLAADGRTLYFSSDRPGGLGSSDIYVAKRIGKDDWSNWRAPVNLGAPINTEDFDGYYTLPAKGDFAYFLSSKGSLGKKDIFRYLVPKNEDSEAMSSSSGNNSASKDQVSDINAKNGSDLAKTKAGAEAERSEGTRSPDDALVVQGNIQGDKRLGSSESSEPVVLISGKVKNTQTGKVPEGAAITYEDLKTGKTIGIATPDPNTGQYKLVLPYGINYGITAKAKGMLPSSINLDLSKLRGRYLELDERDLVMAPIAKGSTVTINNLFFELNKATLTPESEPELKRIVSVMNENKTLAIEISGHTDNTGTDEFNNKLSLDRANAVRDYLLNAGIDGNRIKSKGYGKTKPKESNDTEEGRAANRRVEFVIL